jgi:hypothetical protein
MPQKILKSVIFDMHDKIKILQNIFKNLIFRRTMKLN